MMRPARCDAHPSALPVTSRRSRRNTRLSAGVQVTARSRDVRSATVIVIASARKKLPVTPVTETSGRKTTTGVIVEPTSGTAISRKARRAAWRESRLQSRCRNDVLDHHDRVVDHQSNRGRQAAQRHQVEAFARSPIRNRIVIATVTGITRPATSDEVQSLREKKQDDACEQKPDQDGIADAANALPHQFRLIVVRFETDARRQSLAELLNFFRDRVGHRHGIAGRLARDVQKNGRLSFAVTAV